MVNAKSKNARKSDETKNTEKVQKNSDDKKEQSPQEVKMARLKEIRKLSKKVNPALKKLDIINRNLDKLLKTKLVKESEDIDKLEGYREHFEKMEAKYLEMIPDLG